MTCERLITPSHSKIIIKLSADNYKKPSTPRINLRKYPYTERKIFDLVHKGRTINELAQMYRSGQNKAVSEELYRRMRLMLISYFVRRIHDREDVEDIVNTALMRSFERFNQWHGKYFQAWVLRIAKNIATDRGRLINRRPQVNLDSVTEDILVHSGGIDDLLDRLDRLEKRKALITALANLSPRYRKVLLLKARGMSYRMIGELVAGNEQNAMVLVHRASKKIRTELMQSDKIQ